MESLATAAVHYDSSTCGRIPVRWRRNASVVKVKHDGAPQSAKIVTVAAMSKSAS